jgi:hypothetical protein
MATSAEINAKAKALLDKGQVAAAQEVLQEKPSDVTAAEAEAAKVKEPAPPRKPEIVLYELLDAISSHAGHPPRVAALLAEFRTVTGQDEKPPEK